MAKTERPGLRAALCGAALWLVCTGGAALLPGAAAAQEVSPGTAPQAGAAVSDADIFALIDRGMAFLEADDLQSAYELFTRANDLTFETDTLGRLAQHLPNLALARINMKVEDWAEVGRFSASVATALDVEGLRDHPYRIEAMAFQGVVAYLEDRLNEADLLFRAVRAVSAGHPDLAVVDDLAHFYLAATAFQLSAPDATEIRQAYFDAPAVPGSWVKAAEVAFLYYVDIFAARAAGQDAGELLAIYGGFLDMIEGTEGIDDATMSFYRGFLGLLQTEAGEIETARDTFQARHDFLMQQGVYDEDFLFNVQRLAMARRNLGDVAGAYDFLDGMSDFLRGQGVESGVFAVLEKDMGDFMAAMDRPDRAQAHYRRSYAILREARQRTDPEVLAMRPLIDIEATGFAGFALADELRAAAGAGEAGLAADGAGVMAGVFRGEYLALDAELGALNGGADPFFAVNRALFLALLGFQDNALSDLAAVRAEAPDSTMADLVELVARVWGADSDPEAAEPAILRLDAAAETLPFGQRSAFLALAAFKDYRIDRIGGALARIEAWFDLARQAPSEPGIWHRFARAVMVEVAMNLIEPDQARALWDGFREDMNRAPDLPLLRDYGRVVYLANVPDALGQEGAIVELGAILRRMQDRLPRHHALISITEFSLANGFQWRNQPEQAIDWLDRAATTLRSHPHHSRDALAFVLSEQARLMVQTGQVDRGALIAGEAYDMVDPLTGRPGLMAAVVGNFANAMMARTGDMEQVAAFLAGHLEDERYLSRQPPAVQVQQLITYGDVLADVADWPRVEEVFRRAEAAIAAEQVGDMRRWQVSLDWTRAIAEYLFDIPGLGFEEMARSNTLAARLDAELRAEGAEDLVGGSELYRRAVWTALIGWEYAQTLDGPQP